MEIDGVIAEVTLEQVYENNGSRPLEAVYVFPASTRAAVHAMEMTVGERTIHAKIAPTKQAVEQYEEARSQGKTASLLTQERANVFQMKVANIMPGDRIVVTLSYTELITPTDKVYEFVLPTTVGPRYTGAASEQDASETKDTASWTHTPYLHEGEAPPFELGADIRIESPLPLASVGSPSHHLRVDRPTPTSAELSLSDTDGANRDLIVRYRLAGDTIQSGLLTYKGKKENYFLLMTAPPARAKKSDTVPREHLFVVDISGSMMGFPLQTAQALMRDILAELHTNEYFNILLFSSGKELFSPKSVRATADRIEQAWNWLSHVSGGGGTELLPALEAAAALPKPPGTSRIITVITDGFVTVEAEAYRLIRKNLDSSNLFAFGIGSSVNREIIEVMARAGQGEPFIVLNPEDARKTAARYRTYVDAPLLRNIQVSFDGFRCRRCRAHLGTGSLFRAPHRVVRQVPRPGNRKHRTARHDRRRRVRSVGFGRRCAGRAGFGPLVPLGAKPHPHPLRRRDALRRTREREENHQARTRPPSHDAVHLLCRRGRSGAQQNRRPRYRSAAVGPAAGGIRYGDREP